MSTDKKKVGILGATGTVGQRFVSLLENHPWFDIVVIAASERSSGKKYKEAVHWLLSTPIPEKIANMTLVTCDSTDLNSCDLVFSGLDSSVAGPIETELESRGLAVFSNSKNHRFDLDVPLLVPYVNSAHLALIENKKKSGKGFIVCNPNCSTTGLVVALKPLQDTFGIKELVVVTMQAVSGAGYPGVASLDILDNVVPFIDGEEEKMEHETRKILGTFNTEKGIVDGAHIGVSAHCNRVMVTDGHLASVSLKLNNPASLDQIRKVLNNAHQTSDQDLHRLPSVNGQQWLHISDAKDRPQPRLDRLANNGFAVTVGRLRLGDDASLYHNQSDKPLPYEGAPLPTSSFDVRMTVLVHNTVLGAAGGAILNAELCHVKCLL